MKKNMPLNSVNLTCPVWIISTFNEDGTPDAMNCGWAGVCGARPFTVCIALNTGRQTRTNILRNGSFVVNVGGMDLLAESDLFGMVSGKDADKLKLAGLSYTKSEFVDAPVIDAYPLSLECSVVETRVIGPHLMVLGEVKNIQAREEYLNADGKLDIAKVSPVCYDTVTGVYYECSKPVANAHDIGQKFIKA